jgi:hypothetical protein
VRSVIYIEEYFMRYFVPLILLNFDLILLIPTCLRAAIATMEKQERARIIAMADLKERMKGKEAMALEQGKKMAEIAAEVWNV